MPTPDGSDVSLGVADHLMAFKNDDSKKAAITAFLDYFYTSDVYTTWVQAEGFLPTTKSGAAALNDDAALKPFLDLLPSAQFYPAHQPQVGCDQRGVQEPPGPARAGQGSGGRAGRDPGSGRRRLVRPTIRRHR